MKKIYISTYITFFHLNQKPIKKQIKTVLLYMGRVYESQSQKSLENIEAVDNKAFINSQILITVLHAQALFVESIF